VVANRSGQTTVQAQKLQGFSADRIFLYLCTSIFLVVQFFVAPVFMMDSDEGIFGACAARQIAYQDWPLVNCVDIKPPGIFLIYEATYQLFGAYNSYGMRLAAVLGMAGVSALLKIYAQQISSQATARIAAGMFLLICSPSPFYYALKTEIFSILFILSAIIYVQRYAHEKRILYLLCAGACIGVATLFKQPAILMISACSLSLLIVPSPRTMISWMQANLFLGLGLLLPLGLATGLYFLSGHGDIFMEQMWFRPMAYASHRNMDQSLLETLGDAALASRIAIVIGLLFLLATLTYKLADTMTHKPARKTLLVLGLYSICACVIISLGGHFFASYFLYIWPFLILFMALYWKQADAVALASHWQKNPVSSVLLASAMTLSLVFGIGQAMYLKKADAYSKDMSARMQRHAQPQDQLYVWGYVPELYAASKRVPASRFIVSSMLFGYFHDTSKRVPTYAGMKHVRPGDWDLFIADLTDARSFLLVDSSAIRMGASGNFRPEYFPRMQQFMQAHCTYKETVAAYPVYRCVVDS
jgi:4-amino-4-deoxy-L-arabinose transferase-like glycosyltransferase